MTSRCVKIKKFKHQSFSHKRSFFFSISHKRLANFWNNQIFTIIYYSFCEITIECFYGYYTCVLRSYILWKKNTSKTSSYFHPTDMVIIFNYLSADYFTFISMNNYKWNFNETNKNSIYRRPSNTKRARTSIKLINYQLTCISTNQLENQTNVIHPRVYRLNSIIFHPSDQPIPKKKTTTKKKERKIALQH